MTEFEIKRLTKRVADLEKGYKELSFWHDKWKRLHLKASETAVKNTELQQEVHETMKVMTDSIMDIRQTYQSLLPLTQAMLELTDRVKKLEQKNTGKDHP